MRKTLIILAITTSIVGCKKKAEYKQTIGKG